MECTVKGRVHKKAAMNIPDDSSQFFYVFEIKTFIERTESTMMITV